MITFHPETLSDKKLQKNIPYFLKTMGKLKNTSLIITLPNADAGKINFYFYIEFFKEK